jgi:hypothetical protein
MARSLGDIYAPLRLVLRLNGSLLGAGCGLLLLLTPVTFFVRSGLFAGGSLWPIRLAGAVLTALGVFWLLSANERLIEAPTLILTMLVHLLIAVVLLVCYVRGEFSALFWAGRALIVILFLLCLLGALTPLRYFQADY